MRGLITPAEAGSGLYASGGQRAMGILIRWLGQKSLESGAAAFEGRDAEELLRSDSRNFKLLVKDFESSSLDPSPLLGGHGYHLARWKVNADSVGTVIYQIEDEESFDTAMEHLPEVLGSKLRVTIS
jgi:hypothetical protein